MIDVEFVNQLIRIVDESGLDSIEIEVEGTRIRLAKTPEGGVAPPMAYAPPMMAPPPPPAVAAGGTDGAGGGAPDASAPSAQEVPSHLVDVPSPMVGTFYRAPAPDAPAYVDVGGTIGKGEILCIIEAMKLMNELESELSGRVAEICVENGEPVEYGQLLFRIDPT